MSSTTQYVSDSTAIRQAPSALHWLGTDANGMDVFSRLLYAGRVDLGVAVVSVAIAVVIGSVIGAVSGYVGGALDAVVMRLLEIVQAFPTFILALAVAALLGPGIVNLTIVEAIVSIPSYARLVRAEVRTVRELAYVDERRVRRRFDRTAHRFAPYQTDRDSFQGITRA